MRTDTPYAPIRRIGAEEHETVVGVLVEAFRDDPFVEWLFPEPAGRSERQAGYYHSLLAHPAAEAYLSGRDGVAVWIGSAGGPEPSGAPSGAPDAEVDAGPEPADRLRAVGAALAGRHPADRPHLYLAVMGVVARRRGGGLGSELLRHRLRRAGYDAVGAYLEAASPRSRALYLRHGFEDFGPPVQLRRGPALFPMWRPPTARTTSVPTLQRSTRP
ncbi:GNAT family N-acetyltransferase [Jiangella endophytica]|uniref:GNAT family N-acetyltransferase n=1 Tax=Jiangella endophytica TaxID=1623398 RepID=UPI000E356794|nr:GNAT family N-acetyltransferase [Jiangella endophytica]